VPLDPQWWQPAIGQWVPQPDGADGTEYTGATTQDFHGEQTFIAQPWINWTNAMAAKYGGFASLPTGSTGMALALAAAAQAITSPVAQIANAARAAYLRSANGFVDWATFLLSFGALE